MLSQGKAGFVLLYLGFPNRKLQLGNISVSLIHLFLYLCLFTPYLIWSFSIKIYFQFRSFSIKFTSGLQGFAIAIYYWFVVRVEEASLF